MPKKILLLEDNSSDEKLTLMAFKKGGIDADIVVQRNGQDAVDYLFAEGRFASEGHEPPALVLLDLNLPYVDGFEVLRRLRLDRRTRLLPVVVLTSSKQNEDVTRSYALGANAYVRKPLHFSAFVDAAKTLSGFWLELNEPPQSGSAP